MKPDSQLEKRACRHFATAYKLRILAEADQCDYGELVPLLRREKLYSNQLSAWRKELTSGGEVALPKSAPGPKAAKRSEQKRIEQPEKELAKTQRKLRITVDCVCHKKSIIHARPAVLDGQKRALTRCRRPESGCWRSTRLQ